MREHVRVVVVGGGIAGCSIAYHLARKGWTDVVLLDKGELTSGSTWHAAGLVTHFHTSPTLMRMRQQSIRLYRSFQAAPDAARHWHEVGSLRVASSRDQLRFLARQVGMAKALGLDVSIISPDEAVRIFPLMSNRRLYGAIHLPGDGWLDPSGVTLELVSRARRMGVLDEMLEVPARERDGREILRGMRRASGPGVRHVRSATVSDSEVLPRVRAPDRAIRDGAPGSAIRLP